MAVLRLIVDLEVTNPPGGAFPFATRREFAESAGFEYDQASGGGAVALPITQIGSPTALALTVDKAVTVALGNITLAAGGLVLVIGGAPATNPPTVTNASGSSAKVRGIVLG